MNFLSDFLQLSLILVLFFYLRHYLLECKTLKGDLSKILKEMSKNEIAFSEQKKAGKWLNDNQEILIEEIIKKISQPHVFEDEKLKKFKEEFRVYLGLIGRNLYGGGRDANVLTYEHKFDNQIYLKAFELLYLEVLRNAESFSNTDSKKVLLEFIEKLLDKYNHS